MSGVMSDSSSLTSLSDDPPAVDDASSHNKAEDGLLEPLRNAISVALRPFCVAGDIPVTSRIAMTILPEEPDAQISRNVRFPPSSPDELAPLIDACKQASFGRGREEVLDPEYRQAFVLHRDRFGIIPQVAVDPLVQGIIPAIQQALYPAGEFGGASQRRIVAELDKLNVYGVGDSFKGHVDTPRSSDMFGTLLINLPVKHEGGALVHAPDGFLDAGLPRRTNWGSDDSIGWIAFFSDCPHEVLPVTSGNRVTLTYNLSIMSTSTSASAPPAPIKTPGGVEDTEFQRILTAVADPGIVNEEHPRLCFHLEHRYVSQSHMPADINHHIASTALPIVCVHPSRVMAPSQSIILSSSKGAMRRSTAPLSRQAWKSPSTTCSSRIDTHPYYDFSAKRYGLQDRMPTTIGGLRYQDEARWNDEVVEQQVHILPPNATVGMFGRCEKGVKELSEWLGGGTPDELNVLEVRPPKDMAVSLEVETDADSLVGASFKYLAHGNEPSIAVDYASICIIGSRPGLGVDWSERVPARYDDDDDDDMMDEMLAEREAWLAARREGVEVEEW